MNSMSKGAATARSGFAPTARQPADQDEYDIYIYHPPAQAEEDGHEAWEKKRTTKNRLRALVAAQRLHDTRKYRRVEIKRKSYDPKMCCKRADTFRVYENEKSAATQNAALVFAALLLSAGLGAGAWMIF